MRAARLQLLALALAGCSSTVVAPLPPDSSQSVVLVGLGPDDAPIALYAFERAALPDPLVLPGVKTRAFFFDRALARLVAEPAADGALPLPAASASLDEAWPLPPPIAWAEIDPEGTARFEPRTLAELGDALTGLRVPRPACRPAPIARPVRGPSNGASMSGVARWGDEIVLGQRGPNRSPARIYRLPLDGVVAKPVEGLEGTGDPLLYVDGDELNVWWLDTVFGNYSLVSISKDGRVTPRLPAFFDPPYVSLHLDSIAASRQLGALTLVAILSEFDGITPGVSPATHLVRYDEASNAWRQVASSRRDPMLGCPTRGEHLALELTGPGRGLAGIRRGPFVSFDLSRQPATGEPLVPDTDLCRNAHASFADGAELVVYESASVEDIARPTRILWRPAGGGAWSSIDELTPIAGQGLAVVGDVAIAGIQGNAVAIYEYAPDRPELPPRKCHEVQAGTYAFRVLPIDEDTALVTGDGGSGAVFIDL